jgi:hypothetical protein
MIKMDGMKHQHAGFLLEETDQINCIRLAHEAAEATQQGKVLVPPPAMAGGYDARPMHSSHASGLPTPVMSHNGGHMLSNSITPQPLNMYLQNTIASQRMMVKECVKATLFCRLKFF